MVGMNERATAIDPVAIMAQPNWRIAAVMTAVVAILLLAAVVYSIRFTAAAPRLQRVRVTAREIGDAGTTAMAVAPLFAPQVESKLGFIDFQEALALLHATLESLSARIAILDPSGGVIEANEAWLKFIRAQAPPIESDAPTCRKLQLPEDTKEGRDMLAAFVALVEGSRERCKFVYQTREGGNEKVYEFSATRIEAHGSVHVLVSHDDITDIREASLAAQELSRHVSEIQEDERQRIAGELHDTTGQHLIAISLNVMNLRREMKVSRRVERLIEDIERSAEEAQHEIRLLSYLLYPPQLEHDGARQTIEHYVEGFGRRANLDVTHRVTDAVDELPLDLQRSVLRIIQEAMANVHRHAEATSVAVMVHRDARGLYVEVRDDGRGMSRTDRGGDETQPSLGVGIPGMRARLRQFNGTLQIESSRAGTVLKARIPSAAARRMSSRFAPGSRTLQ
jgi:two-component system, NarL family, sensor kinase